MGPALRITERAVFSLSTSAFVFSLPPLNRNAVLSLQCQAIHTTYLDASHMEGAGVFWALDGTPRPSNDPAPFCTLCESPNCPTPCVDKTYDCMWLLSLGTSTRYADVKGRRGCHRSNTCVGDLPQAARNAICLMGPYAVLHLGGEQPLFLLFDRIQIHRVYSELHSGNALYAAKHEGHFPFRAQWCHAPDVGGTTLFLT